MKNSFKLKPQFDLLTEKSWYYIFVVSLKITSLYFVPFLLLKIISKFADKNISVSNLIESGMIFDYLTEVGFYTFVFWTAASFSCLLIWLNSRSRQKIDQ